MTASLSAETGTGTAAKVQHHVVEVRATGVTPEAVAERMQSIFDEHDAEGWTLETVQPVIYNSSTTGYFLLVFVRPATAGA